MKVSMGTFQTGPLRNPTRESKTHSSWDSSAEAEDFLLMMMTIRL